MCSDIFTRLEALTSSYVFVAGGVRRDARMFNTKIADLLSDGHYGPDLLDKFRAMRSTYVRMKWKECTMAALRGEYEETTENLTHRQQRSVKPIEAELLFVPLGHAGAVRKTMICDIVNAVEVACVKYVEQLTMRKEEVETRARAGHLSPLRRRVVLALIDFKLEVHERFRNLLRKLRATCQPRADSGMSVIRVRHDGGLRKYLTKAEHDRLINLVDNRLELGEVECKVILGNTQDRLHLFESEGLRETAANTYTDVQTMKANIKACLTFIASYRACRDANNERHVAVTTIRFYDALLDSCKFINAVADLLEMRQRGEAGEPMDE